MKRLLTVAFLALMLCAFGGVAHAELIYQEDFSYTKWDQHGGKESANWTSSNSSYIWASIDQNNAISGGPALILLSHRSSASYSIMLNQTMQFKAGESYTVKFDVQAYGSPDAPDASIGIYFRDSIMYQPVNIAGAAVDVNGKLWFDVPYSATDNVMQTLEWSFTVDAANVVDVPLFFCLVANDNSAYIIDNFSITRDGSSAVPIPGALFLLAPGVAGLAALKRRMK